MLTTRRIATQFPAWTLSQCRAYRAGALAGQREASIREGYEYGGEDEFEDDLTLFFFRGYADAMGREAEGEAWYEEIVGWIIVERWWAY